MLYCFKIEVARVACQSRSCFSFFIGNNPNTRMSSDVNDFVNAKSHAREKAPHFPAMQQHTSYCYYDCWCMREAYWCKFEFKIKNRSFGYPFYYKRPHFMTHSFIHLASHTEWIPKWFLNKIHEMRVFRNKKIVCTTHVSLQPGGGQ